MADLMSLRPVQRLSPRVVRILGCNPGPFTLQGTNVYLVGTGARRILIDCSDGNEAFIAALRDTLTEQRCTVAAIVVTHAHGDHCGGVPAVLRLLSDLSR